MRPHCRATPEGGGVRVTARDWPGAAWIALPLLALGLPLVVWSAAGGHPIEGGGGVVFVGVGAFAAWLGAAKRRDLLVAREGDGVRVVGREGAGPVSRPVDLVLPADTVPDIRPFGVPEGAPDLSDRGGDLVLRGGGVRIHLARATGPGWRERLDAACGPLRAALDPGSSRRPGA